MRTPEHGRLLERGLEPLERRAPRPAVGDELRQHRVVPVADHVARRDAGVDPYAVGPPEQRDAPGRRQEARLGILGVEPRLDRVAAISGTSLPSASRASRRRRSQLVGDQVAPVTSLGHRVLDLEPRVHLEEVELAAHRRAGTRTVPALT